MSDDSMLIRSATRDQGDPTDVENMTAEGRLRRTMPNVVRA